MRKLISTMFSMYGRQIAIITAGIIVVLIILDLLATRQILYSDNVSEIILFALTVVVGYGVGSWILLEYTIKFTEEGSITVNMKRERGDNNAANNNGQELVVVSVQDTGKGIDPFVKGKLFEKFETKSEKGIGLGLYISRKIIEAHGGRVWAENNADGKGGATFYFTLPLSK